MEHTLESKNAAPYHIGETNAQAVQDKIERLNRLLEPLAPVFWEAYYSAKPGQYIEIDLPVTVFEHIFEQEPTDSKSIISVEVAFSIWLINHLKGSFIPTKLYLDITIQNHSWLSKLGLITPNIQTNKGLMASSYANRCRDENCLDFRFYCYIEKPLDV